MMPVFCGNRHCSMNSRVSQSHSLDTFYVSKVTQHHSTAWHCEPALSRWLVVQFVIVGWCISNLFRQLRFITLMIEHLLVGAWGLWLYIHEPTRTVAITQTASWPGNGLGDLSPLHGITRATTERCTGVAKHRWHCLHGELREAPDKACKVICACFMLHNRAIKLKHPLHELPDSLPCEPATEEISSSRPSQAHSKHEPLQERWPGSM